MLYLSIFLAHLISFISRLFNLGAGGSFAGKIILAVYPQIVERLTQIYKGKIIFVTGTNGKTTTSKLIAHILSSKYSVIYNKTGANLIQGIVTLLLSNIKISSKDIPYAVLEIDELHLASFGYRFKPAGIVFLNLFRDQMDRYGELDTVKSKWNSILKKLDNTTVYLNADDPNINSLKKIKDTVLFGISKEFEYTKTTQMAKDSILCPICHANLNFNKTIYSHIGDFICPQCGFNNTDKDLQLLNYKDNTITVLDRHTSNALTLKLPFEGIHNAYNTLAAISVAMDMGIELSENKLQKLLNSFELPFGRMETIKLSHGGILKLYLIKNPVGASQSLQMINENIQNSDKLVIAINNNTVDGIDVSWLWDITVPQINNKIWVSGKRAAAMANRLSHASLEDNIEMVEHNIAAVFDKILIDQTNYYFIANYTSMIEIQNIMKAKKIKQEGYWNG
jgi:UDP-N-acetylmuramyl tripeptide synthase